MNTKTTMVSAPVVADAELKNGDIMLPVMEDKLPETVDVIRMPFHPPIIDTPIDKIRNFVRRLLGKPIKHRYDTVNRTVYSLHVVGKNNTNVVKISYHDAMGLDLDYDGDTITYSYSEKY